MQSKMRTRNEDQLLQLTWLGKNSISDSFVFSSLDRQSQLDKMLYCLHPYTAESSVHVSEFNQISLLRMNSQYFDFLPTKFELATANKN